MKSKVFAFLAALLMLVTSISVVGCGGGEITITGLTFSANPAEVGTAVTISATITNSGAAGTCNATLVVSGTNVETQSIAVAEKATQTVTFTYTPTTEGNLNVSITPGYQAKGILGVTKPVTGYWDIRYKLAEGSKVTFNYSLLSGTPYNKVANLKSGDGNLTIRVNKTVVNGAREIIVLSSGWQLKSIFVEDISPGVSMDVTMSLPNDSTGVLYVKDGVGDVDMSSISSRTTKPKQIDTYGDGTKDPAGSLLVNLVLLGDAHTTVGKDIPLPFGLIFTTGTIINTVSIPSSKFNGAKLSSQGVVFAKDGALKVADYVGTAGTITTTGTGDCLGLTLVGMAIDFQAEIKLVLEPVSVTSK